jgi:hypothetical protein
VVDGGDQVIGLVTVEDIARAVQIARLSMGRGGGAARTA